MSVWDTYIDRLNARGVTRREASLKREKRQLLNKVPDNLSYQQIIVFDQAHGYNVTSEEMASAAIEQEVAIINSDNLNEKYLYTLPNEDIECGTLVHWMDNYWLVNEKDANTTVYTRAKLLQCNYLLKWVTPEDEIIEQWCYVEDGTKLKHMPVCNSLVYRKRYAKRTLLIAGNSLETCSLQRDLETKVGANAKKQHVLDNQQPILEQRKVQRLSRTWE